VDAQMRQDEAEHAEMAVAAGAAILPQVAKKTMGLTSSMMTRIAFWV